MCFTTGPRATSRRIVRDEALDAAMLRAHEAGDSVEIGMLYGRAGDAAERADDIDQACFFWVQAMVFLLEAGSAQADRYRLKLVRNGREVSDQTESR